MWGRFLESGEYSDFEVVCSGREFQVHRIIICPRSSYFRNICKENFKEGITKRLELADEDPNVFQAVLTFLYTGIYETAWVSGNEEIGKDSVDLPSPDSSSSSQKLREEGGGEESCSSSLDSENDEEMRRRTKPATTSDILAHVQLYASGDKFDIMELVNVSSRMFQNQLKSTPCVQLDLAAIIRAVYQWTRANDTGLRPILIDYCVQNLDQLIEREDIADVLSESGEFSWQLLRSFKGEADLRSRKAAEDQRTAVIESKRIESQQLKDSLLKLQKRDTHLMELMATHHNCRNCGRIFGASPQVYGPASDRVMLRCKGCYTKHTT
jgi:BTB/POZ domain